MASRTAVRSVPAKKVFGQVNLASVAGLRSRLVVAGSAAAVSTTAGTAPAAGLAGPTVSLRVSYSNPIATNLPEWMAPASGIFTQHGLDVDLTNIASSTGIPGVLSGDVQVAAIGGSETLSAAAQGADLAIIGVSAPVYPFVFMAQPSLAGVDQLKGKKIGVSNIAWLNTHRDVAQRYIDAIVEAIARSRQDRELAIKVLQKYLNSDDQRALQTTYDFLVGQVTPPYPTARSELFADSITQLSASNDRIKTFDVTRVLDTSFVQSAMDRHLGGP